MTSFQLEQTHQTIQDFELATEERIAPERQELNDQIAATLNEPQSIEQSQALVSLAKQVRELESNPERYFSTKDAAAVYEHRAAMLHSGENIDGIGRAAIYAMAQTEIGRDYLEAELYMELHLELKKDILEGLGRSPEAAQAIIEYLETEPSYELKLAGARALRGREEATATLLNYLLSSEDKSLIAEAAQALIGNNKATNALISIYKDEGLPIFTRAQAIRALSGDPEAVRTIIDAFCSEDPDIRDEGIRGLNSTAEMRKAYLKLAVSEENTRLLEGIPDNSWLRSHLLEEDYDAYWAEVERSDEARAFFLHTLKTGNYISREHAATELQKDDEAISELLNLLRESRSDDIQALAVKALKGNHHTEWDLIDALASPSERVVEAAISSLQGSWEAGIALSEYYKTEEDEDLRKLAVKAMRHSSFAEECLLGIASSNERTELRAEAVSGLWANERTLETLLRSLDQEASVSRAAAEALTDPRVSVEELGTELARRYL